MKPQKTTDHQSSSNSVAPVVLFGLDKNGKPKAARFEDKHATLATKAAGPMDLHVLAITDPRIAEVAAHLPAGRIHANGRGFVPFIRQDLYAVPVQVTVRQIPRGILVIGRLTGTRSPPATWSLPKIVCLTVGTPPLWSSGTATCSRCDGAITRGNEEYRSTGSRLGFSTPGPTACRPKKSRPPRSRQRTKRQVLEKNRQRNQAKPTSDFRRVGTRSTSTISCSPKKMARGERGGRQYQSKTMATF